MSFKNFTRDGGYVIARNSVVGNEVYIAVEDDGAFADAYLTRENALKVAQALIAAATGEDK